MGPIPTGGIFLHQQKWKFHSPDVGGDYHAYCVVQDGDVGGYRNNVSWTCGTLRGPVLTMVRMMWTGMAASTTTASVCIGLPAELSEFI